MDYFDIEAKSGCDAERRTELSEAEIQNFKKYDFVDVDVDTVELYSAGSVKPITKQSFSISPRPCEYPKPPTEEYARYLYMNDEITELEFEQMLETAFVIEGIDWGNRQV